MRGDGNVGIGTDSPGYNLDVSGNINFSGNLYQSGSLFSSTAISDSDGDTKIQVEESADEDMIRFDIGGTEYFIMENGRIHTQNNGRSVFIGQNAGLDDDQTNNENVFIGHQCGQYNESASCNVAIGRQALRNHTSGNFSIALGNYSLHDHQTGANNVAIGGYAMNKNIDGADNIILGKAALLNATTGDYNVAIGSSALFNGTDVSGNVVIGWKAGYDSDGSDNVFIGKNAGGTEDNSNRLYIENTDSTSPLIYGEFDNDLIRINGELQATGNVGIGTDSPSHLLDIKNTSGSAVISLTPSSGYKSRLYFKDDSENIIWNVGLETDGSFNFYDSQNSSNPFIIEPGAATNTLRLDSSSNVGLGGAPSGYKLDVFGDINFTGDLYQNGSAFCPISISDSDGDTKIQVEESVDEDIIRFDVGGTEYWRMKNNRLETVNTNNSIFIGNDAGLLSSGQKNVAIGFESADALTGQQNTAVGAGALANPANGSYNTALGCAAGMASSGDNNIYLGYLAGADQTGDYKLYINCPSYENDPPLIYGEFDNDLVKINGELQTTGKVGIGTDDPSSLLHIKYTDTGDLSGTTGFRIQNGSNHYWNIAAEDNSGDEDLQFSYNGTKKASADESSGNWYATSDRRLKKNIRDTQYGLDNVLRIEVSDYQFKDDPDQTDQTGFMAQQLYEIYPPAVAVGSDEPDGQFWGVAYGALTPLLVKGMQEQQEKIETLEAQIEELRAMIEALQK